MGCDGGTIPRRDELVRLKKKPEKVDKSVDLAAKWQHCALSQEPLRAPIVSCELGRLYNKDKVIELLLDRSKFEDPVKVEHIRGLKDVRELQPSENPAYQAGDDKAETYVTRASQYICPITGLEMNGRYKFQYFWGCGCVFAERALKEFKSASCNKCGKPVSEVITMNGSEEEMEALRTVMEGRRLKAKLEKKSKKKKKAAETAGSADGEIASKKACIDTKEQSATTNGKQKLTNGLPSKSSSVASKAKDEKKPRGVQNDPSASKVFKSLFTSSKEAKSKGSAHWVTHNPFYN